MILRPVGLAVSLCFVCSVLIFPTSSSSIYVGSSIKFITACTNLSRKNLEIIETKDPASDEFLVYKELESATGKLRSGQARLEMVAKTIGLELSIGRMDAGDIGEMQSIITSIIAIVSAFQVYYKAVEERKSLILNNTLPLRRASTNVSKSGSFAASKIFTSLQDTYKPVGVFETGVKYERLKNILQQKDNEENLTLEDLNTLQTVIARRYSNILKNAIGALDVGSQWLKETNEFRIMAYLIPGRFAKCRAKQQISATKIKELKISLKEEFETLMKDPWDAIHSKEFDNEELLLFTITLGSLFGHFVQRYISIVTRFLDLAIDVDTRRPTPVLITPFTKLIRKKAQFPKDGLDSGEDSPQENFSLRKDIDRRDPDSSPPKKVRHLIGRKILRYLSLLGNKHFLFSLKLAFFCLLSIGPFLTRTTAKWYYMQRLIWVPVMVALSAAEFAGDVVYNFLSRMVATFVAGIIAMAAWYISSGRGRGNVWGFGIVSAVVGFFAAFYRLYSVHQIIAPAILLPVTVFLILGTSWQDGRPNQITSLTNGFNVAWIRFVTVAIGVSIAFIASILPKPRTARATVRQILSRVIEENGNLHGAITQYAIEKSHNPMIRIAPRYDEITLNLRTLFRKLAYNQLLFPSMKWEPSLVGVWPRRKYERLQSLVTEIVQLYFSLYYLIDQFEDPVHNIPLLLARCGFTNPALQADLFSVLHMSSGALRSSSPLPMVTPAHTSILHANYIYDRWALSYSSLGEQFFDENKEDNIIEGDEVGRNKTIEDWRQRLDLERILSNDGRLLIVGIYFAHLIYERVDEVMYVVKGLVGEEFEVDLNLFREWTSDKEYETIKKVV